VDAELVHDMGPVAGSGFEGDPQYGSKLLGAVAFHNVLQNFNLTVREKVNNQFGIYSLLRRNDRRSVRAVLFSKLFLHTP